jgi:hypothetical protein
MLSIEYEWPHSVCSQHEMRTKPPTNSQLPIAWNYSTDNRSKRNTKRITVHQKLVIVCDSSKSVRRGGEGVDTVLAQC